MTNDDRSNEDGAGDGRAPSWGEAPQHRPEDAPRYGEHADQQDAPRWGASEARDRDDEPRYGERAPQYGERAPQYGEQAPRYGEHAPKEGAGDRHDSPTWGEQHGSHQPYAASAAPASAGGPAWHAYEEPKRKKKTVGVIAFLVGLLSLVVGVIGGAMIGAAVANSGILDGLAQGGTAPSQQELQQRLMQDPSALSSVGSAGVVVGIAAILGLWAFVQGIIAVATKRGRGWGLFAIILAVVATVATFGTYIAIAASAVVGNS
ncbi:DUF4064 domain-containing protein [Curtobacterium sp. UCD-KPL2560]|uniref:DUF4064 domain-containing protein n=1 Tax=Curtobacterium sp. UCD-KPL2560 TaxID=1885315 RepID=UPI00082451A2|nr:DUF4064 domain-containing protein [Curtobacterium sp. UCD-KPL2560]